MSSNECVNALIDTGTQSLLSAIGNHEAKSLAAAVINVQPDKSFSIRQLESEMVTRQGENPAWHINSGTVADYCTATLLPIGAVAREDVQIGRGIRRAFHSTPFGVERGVPFTGAVFEWSFEYPQVSVQKLLGITAVAGESTRSPVMSYAIIQELVTNPYEGEVSVASIRRSLGDGIDASGVIDQHLGRLQNEGLIEVRTDVQDYNPIYRIYRDKTNVALSNEVAIAIRNVCQNNVEREVSLAQLLEEISKNYPDLSQSDARRLMTYVTSKQRLPFLEVTGANGTPINHSAVTLKPVGKIMLGAFVDVVESSAQDGEQHFRKRAADVVSEPEKFRQLMNKARRASNSTKPGANRDLILDELASKGEVSAAALRESLASRGYKIGKTSLRRYLRTLEDEGAIGRENKPLSSDLKRKADHYRLAVSNPLQ